jgi:hypothetical protein
MNAERRCNAVRQIASKMGLNMFETEKTDTTASVIAKIASAKAGGTPAPIVWGEGVACMLQTPCGRCTVLCTRAIRIMLQSSDVALVPWRDRRFGPRQAKA